ncbi:MAG TPA: PPC domain-containing protein [Thermoanaerobaculia bacterium]
MSLALLLVAIVSGADAIAQQCGTNAVTFFCPASIGAALTTDDCASADSSQYDLWQFSATAGQTVTIDMHSTAFDTFLALIDPSGIPVAENDDLSSSSTDSRISITLTSSGTWTIVANSLNASKTGDYNLQLSCGATITARRRAVRHGSN